MKVPVFLWYKKNLLASSSALEEEEEEEEKQHILHFCYFYSNENAKKNGKFLTTFPRPFSVFPALSFQCFAASVENFKNTERDTGSVGKKILGAIWQKEYFFWFGFIWGEVGSKTWCVDCTLVLPASLSACRPTTNGGMQNGSSVGIYSIHNAYTFLYVWRRFVCSIGAY